jgi:phospholipid/cholesterol/gamma-HCH transport system substrate-binding protein
MNTSRSEWKVGLFVLTGLVLLAVLLLQFAKGTSFFKPSYEIRLTASNVGAIKPNSAVLMSGINIGSVTGTELNSDGKSVTIRAKILKKYQIHPDAMFEIDQSGFLGDMFVSITPGANNGTPLENGAVVQCREPFNIQDTARSADNLMKKLESTVNLVNKAVERVDRVLLAEQTLTTLTNTLDNLHAMSTNFTSMAAGMNQLIHTNSTQVQTALSNLVLFSSEANRLTENIQTIVHTNEAGIHNTVINLESASGDTRRLLADLQAGNGLAGELLKSEDLSRNFNQAVSNLTVLSSNLTKYGLLYKPKPVKPMVVYRTRLKSGNGMDQ